MFKLSKKSYNNLIGVDSRLISCVEGAIKLTSVDFYVNEGLRTLARQRQLVAKGASKTMNSYHITGHAVDLVALIDGRISWEEELYYPIAEAMITAAEELGTQLTWGAAWNIPNITQWNGTARDAVKFYTTERYNLHKKPFLDFPHFQIDR